MEQQPGGSKGFDVASMALAAKIILVAGILLLVSASCNGRRSASERSPDSPERVRRVSAWSGSGSFFGFMMGILLIALLIFEGVQLANVNMNMPISSTKISAYLAFAVGAFAILKVLLVLTSSIKPSIFAWIGLVLALVVAYGGYLDFKAPEPMTPPPPAAS